MTSSLFIILGLIAASAFFTTSEIAFAASRKLKLQQLAEDGNANAAKIITLKQHPGHFFTVVTIGLNAVAILGGIVGESALTPYFTELLSFWLPPSTMLEHSSSVLSFVAVTALFVLFADLLPKRLAIMMPEPIALKIVQPMLLCLRIFKPLVWLFNGLANGLLALRLRQQIDRLEIRARFGMNEDDFGELAQLMARVIVKNENVADQVTEFRSRFMKMRYTLPLEESIALASRAMASAYPTGEYVKLFADNLAKLV